MSIEQIQMFKTSDGKLHASLDVAGAHEARLELITLFQLQSLPDAEEVAALIIQHADKVQEFLWRAKLPASDAASEREELGVLLHQLPTPSNRARWDTALSSKIVAAIDSAYRIPLELDSLDAALRSRIPHNNLFSVLAVHPVQISQGQTMLLPVLEVYADGHLLGPSAPLYDVPPALVGLVVRAVRKHL